MPIENKDLLDKAKELSIEVKDDTKEEDLKKTVSDKEEANRVQKENENNVDYLKSELTKYKDESKKAFDARDTAKKERRALQNKITEMDDKLKDAPDASKLKELSDELKTLKDFKKTADAAQEEEDLKNKTELEKAEVRHKKVTDGFAEQLEALRVDTNKKFEDKDKAYGEKEKEVESLRVFRLENEIRDIASSNKAVNPKQIVKLLKDDFEYNKDLDKFEHTIRDEKGKVSGLETVEEKVKKFLEDSDNENLVESDVNTQGMNTHQTTTTTTKYTGKDKSLVAEAAEKGLSVEKLIAIKVNRDNKLAKIKGQK